MTDGTTISEQPRDLRGLLDAVRESEPRVQRGGWNRRSRVALVILSCVLLAAVILAAGAGALSISPAQITAIAASKCGFDLSIPFSQQQATVFWVIRLPRVCAAVLFGGGLAIAGAALQGLFRNPLADPALIGTSSGAALGAVLTILAGAASPIALPLAAFIGGLLSMVVVYLLARREGRTVITNMLLAGVALSAFCNAGIGLAMFAANDVQLRSITFWSLGSLGGANWKSLVVPAAIIVPAAVLLLRQYRLLNALLLGEAEVGHLGFDLERSKRWIVVLTALAVGAAVSSSGIIGFVGLVAPHLVRLWIGPQHRALLPCSMLLGAILLTLADLLCRTLAAPAEIPVGIVTALLGVPFFLWLLRRQGI